MVFGSLLLGAVYPAMHFIGWTGECVVDGGFNVMTLSIAPVSLRLHFWKQHSWVLGCLSLHHVYWLKLFIFPNDWRSLHIFMISIRSQKAWSPLLLNAVLRGYAKFVRHSSELRLQFF